MSNLVEVFKHLASALNCVATELSKVTEELAKLDQKEERNEDG